MNVGKHQFTLFKVIGLRDFVIHTLQVSVDFDCLQVPFDITFFSSVIILAVKNEYLGDFLM